MNACKLTVSAPSDSTRRYPGHSPADHRRPGSPSATTTIPGNQLPPPPPKFGGVIKETYKDSTPWWPPRVVPPNGAPNILLI